MKDEYDFSKGKRGPVISDPRKTRITIFIDTVILEEFRKRAETAGTGYQTMMNDALRTYLQKDEKPVTEGVLRNILRQELPRYRATPPKKKPTGKPRA